MLNSTIILQNGETEITNLMLYLDNKENLKFDNLRLDPNLSKLAKSQSDYIADHNLLTYFQNDFSLDDRMIDRGTY